MWIKICGNTNLEDARLAADLGADAVGFVFAESPRQMTATQVAEIVPKLPDSVEKIGVFSSRDADEIARIVRETGLTGIQLHGGFDLELARQLNAKFAGSVTVIPVLHWMINGDAESSTDINPHLQALAHEATIRSVLIDSKTQTASGGTGKSFDWAAARTALTQHEAPKVIVAGGLNPGNVRQAIETLDPWGVDVSSGVEASKGRKDPGKLKEFIEAARGF